MKKKLYLLRHGETEFNKKGIYQGILDSPLTEAGIQQVQANAFLLKRKLAAVQDQQILFLSSPLGRAVQSSKLIQQILDRKEVNIVTDERLKEVDVGEWNGKNRDQIQAQQPKIESDTFNWYFKAPNGESLSDVMTRCNEWIADLEKVEEEHVIIMAHGLLGRVLRGCFSKLKEEEFLSLEVPQRGFFLLENQQSTYVTDHFEEWE
ncbi:histidine phosphatase family protein [Enterococcus wangshanyuanii]|uniref:phosphoglycerate mutase (2,3-diphosphoglycerate-dependent) n=1 Tax=Enterococcus wangshanyuanii TaxID=2005703 RepID=A0ABQ1NMI0_9ENTE|nr:histidine phosphatase family protein [Enterococcus wangshanyuanii]GGC80130.1 phosphoglycerate mutase [Enterococcus wangshanyuanii]